MTDEVKADLDAVFEDLLGHETPTFAEPWQARAFALTVVLYDEGDGFDWTAFQRRLIDAVDDTAPEAYAPGDGDSTDAEAERIYYEQWCEALERLLVEEAVITPDELDARAGEFAAGVRTAEEFVEGDRGHHHGT